jgi:hypothetical protein
VGLSGLGFEQLLREDTIARRITISQTLVATLPMNQLKGVNRLIASLN